MSGPYDSTDTGPAPGRVPGPRHARPKEDQSGLVFLLGLDVRDQVVDPTGQTHAL
jgi:hypothetical protein